MLCVGRIHCIAIVVVYDSKVSACVCESVEFASEWGEMYYKVIVLFRVCLECIHIHNTEPCVDSCVRALFRVLFRA